MQQQPAALDAIPNSRAAFWGWIDLERLGRSSIGAIEGVGVDLQAAGIRLNVANGTARVVRLDEGIAIVAGRPFVGDSSEVATDAQVGAFLMQRDDRQSLCGRYAIVHIGMDRPRVRLFSDRFGVYPLCYSVEGKRFAFSDRADSVPSLVRRELDPQAIFNYAYFHVLPAPRTAFRGVQRMEPAQCLQFSDRGLELAATWRPRFASAGPKVGARPTAGEFRNLLRAAVEREADGSRVGAYLSGGTDSSTIAGMLREVRGAGQDVFSIGFEAEGYDEIEYAKIAARHFDCRHHVYYVTPDDVVAAVPQIAGQYDQPFGNSSALPAYYCARFARDSDVGKLLAGDGSDELFGGNVRYAKQKVFEAYAAALPSALRRSLIEPALLSAHVRSAPGLRKLSSYVAQARIPMPDRTESYNLLHRHGVANLFTPRFVEMVDVAEPERLQRLVYAESAGAALVDRMLAYDWRFTLADNDLPKVVGTARLAGVDVGFPLLDDAIVDFSLRLSASQKVRGFTLRHWFKQALTGFLPNEVITKKKHGFGLPFGPWLVKHAGLQRLARDSIDGLVERGMIRVPALEKLFSADLQRYPGYYGEMIWILMMAEQWLRRAAPDWRVD